MQSKLAEDQELETNILRAGSRFPGISSFFRGLENDPESKDWTDGARGATDLPLLTDRDTGMARKVIVGPNPLGTNRLTADERLKELSDILAAGMLRLRLKQESRPDGQADGDRLSTAPNPVTEPRPRNRRFS